MTNELLRLLEHPDKLAAIAALASAVAALLSLITSVLAIVVSTFGVRSQRKHSILSVKPLIHINVIAGDLELSINGVNSGLGPMIIKRVSYLTSTGEPTQIFNAAAWIARGLKASAVLTTDFKNQTVSQNTTFGIFEIKLENGEGKQILLMKEIQNHLNGIQIKIEYTDLYGTKFSPHLRKLEIVS